MENIKCIVLQYFDKCLGLGLFISDGQGRDIFFCREMSLCSYLKVDSREFQENGLGFTVELRILG